MVAFRSGSALSYGVRTTTTFTAPSGITNDDILICAFYYSGYTPPAAPTVPSGFTLFATMLDITDGSWHIEQRIYWKRASGESGNYSFTHSSFATQGYIAAYSGCLTSGTPLGATSTNTATSGSSGVGTGITTTADNSFLLFIGADLSGSGGLTPPSGMTERRDLDDYWADELRASAGATGNRTQTNNGSGWGIRMVELLNVVAAPWPPDGTSDAPSRLKVITTGLRW